MFNPPARNDAGATFRLLTSPSVDPGPRTYPDMLVALQVPRNSYAASLPPSVVYRWVDKSLPDLDFNVEQQMIRGSP